jgi:hypothetical protein
VSFCAEEYLHLSELSMVMVAGRERTS